MRFRILFILLIAISLITRAQQITGRVLLVNTETVIPGASVYFGGSTKGTSTNSLGVFTLTATNTQVPLVVSCIGYYSTTVTDYGPTKPVTVYLKPKENVMREVQIGTDGMSRKEKLRLFRREFIGISPYAMSCTIVNVDDIDLHYDKNTETLTAFCNNPIVIKNKMLGYTINYFLDKFTRADGHVHFAGNYLFKEDSPANPADQKQLGYNREDVYSGSRMQFIRSLWSNTLKKHGFELYDEDYVTLTAAKVLYTSPAGNKYVQANFDIHIAYKRDYNRPTILCKKEDLSFIDKDGFYGGGLGWAGRMSNQRIGDLLPFEYVSPQDGKN